MTASRAPSARCAPPTAYCAPSALEIDILVRG